MRLRQHLKLYLSSDGFLTKTQFKYLVGKKYKDARIALIMNAIDWRTSKDRKERYNKARKGFKRIGIKVEIIDLRKFYHTPLQGLVKKLLRYDLIWVRGGNTFLLRYVMKKSGFDKAIKNALAKGTVYGGESAGALIMGPTLKHLEGADNPNVASKVIWEGIKLIDTVPLPHWGSRVFKEVIKKAYKAYNKDKIKVIKLVDGEALLVEGKKIKKVKTNRYWRA